MHRRVGAKPTHITPGENRRKFQRRLRDEPLEGDWSTPSENFSGILVLTEGMP
jgi:hypothetical protein